MTLKRMGTVCAVLTIGLTLAGQGFAQTTGTSSDTTTGTPTAAQLQQLLQLLNASGGTSSSQLSALLGSLTGGTTSGSTDGTTSGSTAATSQPTGSPRNFIVRGIAQHQAFNNSAFNLTPAQRRAAMSQPTKDFKVPIALVLPLLANFLADRIPALGFLADLFGHLTPITPSGPTPPAAKTGLGPVAFVTTDDATLAVGKTTTGRLWVQQSTPNTAKDNGIFSVAVNITASPAGLVQSQVPVTVLSTWNSTLPATKTGTVNVSGGIDELGVAQPVASADKSVGTNGPVEVLNFTIKAVSAGTVTLTPTNFSGGGFTGIIAFGATSAEDKGNDANYVSATITVK